MRPARLLLLSLALVSLLAACADADVTPSPLPVDSADEAARAAAVRSPLLAGIGPLDPDAIGTAHWWEATELAAGAGWQVTFRAGWGDCTAGCIDKHTWTYDVARDGTVTFVGEDGPPLPQPVIDELTAVAAEREQVVGVAGRATAGPVCPVERPNDPTCFARSVAFATVVVTDAGGGEVARTETDEAGFFRAALAPGAYVVVAQPVEGLMGTPAPVSVTVPAGLEAWLDLAYDTGIR